ncbi:MAG: hypothetical protein ACTSYA_06615 [Candidatus Kariarchaeaceae archaeon]
MIVLANEEFATGLRLAGVKASYHITERKQAEDVLKDVELNAFIIATKNVVALVPKLEDYPNLIVFPDTLEDFSKIDDLKEIIKNAIGSEVEI